MIDLIAIGMLLSRQFDSTDKALSIYPLSILFYRAFIELEHRLAIKGVLDLGIRSDVRTDHAFHRRRSFESTATLCAVVTISESNPR